MFLIMDSGISLSLKSKQMIRTTVQLMNDGYAVNTVNFRKYPQGLYFSKALFEGLIFGGAYARRAICVSKSIGLAF